MKILFNPVISMRKTFFIGKQSSTNSPNNYELLHNLYKNGHLSLNKDKSLSESTLCIIKSNKDYINALEILPSQSDKDKILENNLIFGSIPRQSFLLEVKIEDYKENNYTETLSYIKNKLLEKEIFIDYGLNCFERKSDNKNIVYMYVPLLNGNIKSCMDK